MYDHFLALLRGRRARAVWFAITLTTGLVGCASVPSTPPAAPNVQAATVRPAGPLAVPSDLVALTQPAGQQRLMSTKDKQSYWPLAASFETQKNEAYCAVATSVMALNALGVERPQTALYPNFPYYTQEEFFRTIDPQLANPAKVSHEGMTLDQLSAVLSQFHVTVNKYRTSDLSLEQFRDLIRQTTGRSGEFALLNFRRSQMGEIGGGHWSPLAAFDAATDSALMLDVARYKYPPVWVPVAQLYQASLAVDNVSRLARGIIVVSKPRDDRTP